MLKSFTVLFSANYLLYLLRYLQQIQSLLFIVVALVREGKKNAMGGYILTGCAFFFFNFKCKNNLQYHLRPQNLEINSQQCVFIVVICLWKGNRIFGLNRYTVRQNSSSLSFTDDSCSMTSCEL